MSSSQLSHGLLYLISDSVNEVCGEIFNLIK